MANRGKTTHGGNNPGRNDPGRNDSLAKRLTGETTEGRNDPVSFDCIPKMAMNICIYLSSGQALALLSLTTNTAQ